MTANKEEFFLNHQNSTLVIRTAQFEDVDWVFNLAYSEMDKILQRAYEETGGYNWMNWKASVKQALFLPDEHIKIIELASKRKNIGFYWVSSEEVIWLTSIVLISEWQHKGIGKRIMNFIEKNHRVNGQEFFELGVQETNPAIKFYEKLGFEPIERWEGKTIVMQKQLGDKK
ncbi:MAG: GNAT family N-acetyltransferase [Candidatus Hodarchaeota archaeon]